MTCCTAGSRSRRCSSWTTSSASSPASGGLPCRRPGRAAWPRSTGTCWPTRRTGRSTRCTRATADRRFWRRRRAASPRPSPTTWPRCAGRAWRWPAATSPTACPNDRRPTRPCWRCCTPTTWCTGWPRCCRSRGTPCSPPTGCACGRSASATCCTARPSSVGPAGRPRSPACRTSAGATPASRSRGFVCRCGSSSAGPAWSWCRRHWSGRRWSPCTRSPGRARSSTRPAG